MPKSLKTADEIEGMRQACRLASEVLDMLTPHVQPGITTREIDRLAHDYMTQVQQAVPATLGYQPPGYPPYPASLCTSVNHVVCHGIPSDLRLKNGDIVNIDVTVIVDGWHGDSSRMYFSGEPPIKAKRLTQVTYEAMMLGIQQVKPGKTVGDIGHAIQTYAEKHGYGVVRDYCGHGIGKTFHTAPNIVHVGEPGEGDVLKEGMFFTVEPMINAGGWQTILNRHDGWTVTTRDKSLSAQFEHTIGVTKTGFEIFTASPKGLHYPPYV